MSTIIFISVVVRVALFLVSGFLLKMELGIAVLSLLGFMMGGMIRSAAPFTDEAG